MRVIEPSKADIGVIGGCSKAIIFIINHIASHLSLMLIFNAEPNVKPVSCRSGIIPVAELGVLNQILDCSPTSKLPLFFPFRSLRIFRIPLDQLRFLLFLLTASIIYSFAISQASPKCSISNNKIPSQDLYLPIIRPNPHIYSCINSALQIKHHHLPSKELYRPLNIKLQDPHTYHHVLSFFRKPSIPAITQSNIKGALRAVRKQDSILFFQTHTHS
ncbi:uncharacterized protein Bfra_006698 [Botrytis fragariae]|uniref:Uncharacterized protein n=1 Tax=Botrytis fragariae TaxID=1964551 RepID=A0A8H6B586_9HELO|nr:uncharacterized protein Bfra_006698 [Botrytis fragariae]KAF5879490.1 hypothetical protein Bfra_006698 [Botrytis fragariae]